MSGNKKISDFTNKPTPALGDLFLLQDVSTGVYYNVTRAQLAAIFGGYTITNERFDVTGTTITLANTPLVPPLVFKNGQLLNGISVGSYNADFSISGVTITLAEAAAGDLFQILNTHI